MARFSSEEKIQAVKRYLNGSESGFISHFVPNNIELGLEIGLAVGSLLKSYFQQKHNRQES